MELAQLKQRLEDARRFDHEVDGARFSVVMPTEHEVRLWSAYAIEGGARTAAAVMVAVSMQMLLAGVRGWSGVTVHHLLGDGSQEPLEFDASLVPALLGDAQIAWGTAIAEAMQRRLVERRKRTEAAAKN